MPTQSSEPTPEERAVIDSMLGEVRQHFHEWADWPADAHWLIGFAFYEGHGGSECCDAVIGRTAPFALGHRLVEKHGFAWTMLGDAPPRRYAVSHPGHDAPIALDTLDTGDWVDPEDEYDYGPAPPGWRTHHSYERIVRHVGQIPRE